MSIPLLSVGGTPTSEGQFVAAAGLEALYKVDPVMGRLLCSDMGITVRYWDSDPATLIPDMMIAYDDNTFMIWVAGTTNKLQLFWQTAGSIIPSRSPTPASLENPTFLSWSTRLFAIVEPILQNRSFRNINVVGHSLGGACACSIAEWIAASTEYVARIEVLTFGQPKLWIQGSVLPQWRSYNRIVQERDPIQWLPPNLSLGVGVGRALSIIKSTLSAMHVVEGSPSLKWQHRGQRYVFEEFYGVTREGEVNLVPAQRFPAVNRSSGSSGHASIIDEDDLEFLIRDETGITLPLLREDLRYHSMTNVYYARSAARIKRSIIASKYANLLGLPIVQDVPSPGSSTVAEPSRMGMAPLPQSTALLPTANTATMPHLLGRVPGRR